MNFEWDPGKAALNRRKHRVSFHEAATVFGDRLAITYQDPDHSIVEQRFITVGMSSSGRVLLVAHMDRDENISTSINKSRLFLARNFWQVAIRPMFTRVRRHF